ncbi:MAG: adenosylcobinamide-GDP ribazoletransferase [Marinomonas sp.]
MVTIFNPHWQGFKRSLVTYTRIPISVDWNDTIKHTPAVCFLPWVGIVVAFLSAWPLWFDGLSASLQAIFMLLTGVLLTGGFHEDGLMDACDGLVGGWNAEQRLSIMKDSRIGSYAALSIWFVMMLKWLLLTQILSSLTLNLSDGGSALLVWVAVHCISRLAPLLIMNTMVYVSAGQSKAVNMIAKLGVQEWVIALVPCGLFLLLDFSHFIKAVVVLLLFVVGARCYLEKRIAGFNGDTLGAVEQICEVLLLFCLMGALT